MMNFRSLPNIITLSNLFCGFLAILFAIDGQHAFAAWLIIIAVGFDIMDGRVVRQYNIASGFGKELDSLSDLVSFGVAPSVLLYIINGQNLSITLIPLAIYLFCGTYRLARFNVSSNNRSANFFEGLPIPAAGGVIASTSLVLQKAKLGTGPYLLLILAVISAFFMIAKIKYPTFKREKIFRLKYLIGFAAILILFILMPGLTVCLGFLAYALFNPLKLKLRERR